METFSDNMQKDQTIGNVLFLIFVPTILLTTIYGIMGVFFRATVPAHLLFFLLAALILFPTQIYVIMAASKRESGRYSLKSAFSVHQELSWWKVVAYASVLWGFAGLMSVTLAPLEGMLFAPVSERLFSIIPSYFNFTNIDYLQQYSRNVLLLTCGVYFVFNVFVGPIVEELFFRGYLTARVTRFGKYAPLIITVLFSLYHLWLPFNNLFRIIVFYPAYYIAWKKKNIYIAIVFHCLCNLVTSLSYIAAVSAML